MTYRELRARMAEHGITQSHFARVAGLRQQEVSEILNGWAVDPGRQAKVERAIVELKLYAPPPEPAPTVFRVRVPLEA